MKRFMMFALIASFGIAVLFAGGVKKVEALTLKIDDPLTIGIDVIIQDGMAAGVATGMGLTTQADLVADGVVVFNSIVDGTFGADWIVDITVGQSAPPLPGTASLDLAVGAATSNKAAGLDIWLSDAGFSALGATSLIDSFGGTAGGTVAAVGGIGFANVEFVNSFVTPVLALGPGAFSGTSSVGFPAVAGLFSLTKHVFITHTAADGTTFNNSLSVPEPGTIALLGIGLAGLVGARVRRRMKKVS